MRSSRFALAVAIAAALSTRCSHAPQSTDADLHRDKGLAALERADYQTARTELDAARAEYARRHDVEDAAHADLSLARVAEMQADFAGLHRHAIAARVAFAATRDRSGEARALRQLARDRGLTEAAEAQLQDEAIALARNVRDPTLLAEMLADRGDRYFDEGKYAAAMTDYETAIPRFEAAHDDDQLARALVSLGRIYRAHGEPERALPYYQRALALQQKLGDTQGAIQSVNAIAVTDDYLGRRQDALAEYQHALALARATGASRLIAFQLGNLGGAYLKRGESARAIDLLQQALRLPNDALVANIRASQLGEAYRRLGKYREALPFDDAAVAYDRSHQRENSLVETLTERARARGGLGQTDAALEDVRGAFAALDQVRAGLVPDDVLRQGFSKLYQDTYEVAIDLLASRGDAVAALEASEQARSRALLDLLAARHLHVPAEPATIQDVLATAARLDSTLLLYFVTTDATFAWVGTRHGVRLHRIDVSAARLAELVAGTRPARADAILMGRSRDGTAWRELYRLLIEPLRAELPPRAGSRLTIVPHGPLFRLSFAGLQDARGRYLVEDYAIDYAPSVAVLRFTSGIAAGAAGRTLLVADPTAVAPDGTPLPPLAGARDEVRDVAALLPAAGVDTLVGEPAGVDAVRARLPGAGVIHLATHAVVSEASPLDSFLALAGGSLTASDIYRLKLHADLVVLSACSTALGPITGDGVAGLTRAFVYAGAASVLATLWDVADRPTVRVTDAFYRERLAGRHKAEALRDAQLQLLADLRAGRIAIDEPDGPVVLPPDPYLWAGFVLVGEP